MIIDNSFIDNGTADYWFPLFEYLKVNAKFYCYCSHWLLAFLKNRKKKNLQISLR